MFARNTHKAQPTFRSKKRMEIERMADKKRPRAPERTADQVRLTRRTLVFKGLALASFATLTGRLWQLQVRDQQVALDAQQGYSQRGFALPAARGMIYDRDRKLLADNIKNWSVAIVPASLPDEDTEQGSLERRAIYSTLARQLGMPDVVVIRQKELPKDPKPEREKALRLEIYQRLAAALGVPVDDIRDPVEHELALAAENNRAPQHAIKVPNSKADLREDQLAAVRALQEDLTTLGIHVVNPIDYQIAIYGEWDPYVAHIIKTGVPEGVALGIEANRLYLPGVQVDDSALGRRYKVGAEMGHILGYTGPITGEEREKAVAKNERGQTLTDGKGKPFHIYKDSDYLGKAGLEAGLEAILRGKPGRYTAQVNANGKIVGEYPEFRVNPTNGQSVVLTIPLDYQNEVIKILQEGYRGKGGMNNVRPFLEAENEKFRQAKRPDKVRPIPSPAGAAVAINPRTGEILALVSLPGYDPTFFAKGITQKQFDIYLEKDVPDKDKVFPLQNRCIASNYPPGSTMKTFVAMAGLHGGEIKPDTKFQCQGHIRVPRIGNELGGNSYFCWTRDAQHQDLDVREALATSCDVFFYNVAGPRQEDDLGVYTHYYHPNGGDPQYFNGLGIQKLNTHLRLYGFGEPTGIELGDEVAGLVAEMSWKEQTFPGDYWSLGDTLNSAIGQGFMLVTPLQLCNATAAIANGGTLYRPTLVRELLDDQGRVTQSAQPKVVRKLPVERAMLEYVRQGMRMNVDWHRPDDRKPPYQVKGLVAPDFDEQGNAILGSEIFPLPPGIDAGVKTGTAEYDQSYTDDDGLLLKAHAWCAAFAPYNDPEICVLAFVEGGLASATIAAPVVCGMINAWFARKGTGTV